MTRFVRSGRRLLLGATLAIVVFGALAAARIASLPIDPPRTPASRSTLQDGHYDYEGVIHWHTVYSHDATGTYASIAAVANRLGLDFMISTEHNNLNALRDHKEGWYGNTLMLVGIEMSRPQGYLLGLDMPYTVVSRSDSTASVLTKVADDHGLVFISHPENPRWTWKGPIGPRIDGQEILDFTDLWYTASPLRLVSALAYYPFNTPAAYMELYHDPKKTLALWDKETSKRRFVGIYAPDMHQAIWLGHHHLIRFPKAADLLAFAHDHVVMARPLVHNLAVDKPALYSAIAKGHVYVALDVLQNARGFFFSARQADGRTAWMGDELAAGQTTDFTVRLPDQTTLRHLTVRVLRDGHVIAQGPAQHSYTFSADQAGAYRVEVEAHIPTFWGVPRRVVWIYSNPIYLRTQGTVARRAASPTPTPIPTNPHSTSSSTAS